MSSDRWSKRRHLWSACTCGERGMKGKGNFACPATALPCSALLPLPVARHAKRGLIWVKPALNNCQGLFWAGVATDQAVFGQSG
jgi:hypothetical protein